MPDEAENVQAFHRGSLRDILSNSLFHIGLVAIFWLAYPFRLRRTLIVVLTGEYPAEGVQLKGIL